MTIGWLEAQTVGAPIRRELASDVTDSVHAALAAGDGFDAIQEDLLENAGYKIREEAGNAFIEFTDGNVHLGGAK